MKPCGTHSWSFPAMICDVCGRQAFPDTFEEYWDTYVKDREPEPPQTIIMSPELYERYMKFLKGSKS